MHGGGQRELFKPDLSPIATTNAKGTQVTTPLILRDAIRTRFFLLSFVAPKRFDECKAEGDEREGARFREGGVEVT